MSDNFKALVELCQNEFIRTGRPILNKACLNYLAETTAPQLRKSIKFTKSDVQESIIAERYKIHCYRFNDLNS